MEVVVNCGLKIVCKHLHFRHIATVSVKWPTAVSGKADSVRSVSASGCHIGGPIGPGELAIVYGTIYVETSEPAFSVLLH